MQRMQVNQVAHLYCPFSTDWFVSLFTAAACNDAHLHCTSMRLRSKRQVLSITQLPSAA